MFEIEYFENIVSLYGINPLILSLNPASYVLALYINVVSIFIVTLTLKGLDGDAFTPPQPHPTIQLYSIWMKVYLVVEVLHSSV